jgi:hypothetical protein
VNRDRVPARVPMDPGTEGIPEADLSSGRIIVHLFCRTHGKPVGQVRDIPGRGAILLLRPSFEHPTMFTATGDMDSVKRLMEEVEKYRQGEGTTPRFTLRNENVTSTEGWCARGHPVEVDLTVVDRAVASFRRSGSRVKLTV